MEVTRKQTTPNFPKNEHFLSPWGKKCSFFRKFGVLCFLVTSVLRFAFLLITDDCISSVHHVWPAVIHNSTETIYAISNFFKESSMYDHLSSLDTLLADSVRTVKLMLYNGMYNKTCFFVFPFKCWNARVFGLFLTKSIYTAAIQNTIFKVINTILL